MRLRWRRIRWEVNADGSQRTLVDPRTGCRFTITHCRMPDNGDAWEVEQVYPSGAITLSDFPTLRDAFGEVDARRSIRKVSVRPGRKEPVEGG